MRKVTGFGVRVFSSALFVLDGSIYVVGGHGRTQLPASVCNLEELG
jgi:hypothetical protein